MLYRQLLDQWNCSSPNIEFGRKESFNKGLCLDCANSWTDKYNMFSKLKDTSKKMKFTKIYIEWNNVDRQTERQRDRRACRQTGGQTERWACRQTEGQTDKAPFNFFPLSTFSFFSSIGKTIMLSPNRKFWRKKPLTDKPSQNKNILVLLWLHLVVAKIRQSGFVPKCFRRILIMNYFQWWTIIFVTSMLTLQFWYRLWRLGGILQLSYTLR